MINWLKRLFKKPRWYCIRCKTYVVLINGYKRCECTESPSPWDLV